MRYLMVLVVSLSGLGCSELFAPTRVQCGEFRRIAGHADIDASNVQLGTVDIGLSEPRDTTQATELIVTALGPSATDGGPLKGRVNRLRVLNAAGAELSVQEIHSYPVGTYGGAIFWTPVTVYDRETFAELRRELLAGELQVELTTDESPARVLVLVPHLTESTDWIKVFCV